MPGGQGRRDQSTLKWTKSVDYNCRYAYAATCSGFEQHLKELHTAFIVYMGIASYNTYISYSLYRFIPNESTLYKELAKWSGKETTTCLWE